MTKQNKILDRSRRIAILLACWLLASPASFAHPMGNFSINHYAGIRIEQGFIEIRYLIDMAEIPTFQEIQQNNFAAQSNDPRVRAYLLQQAEFFKTGLRLTLNGQTLPLQLDSQEILFSPGAGNLPTMKFGLIYRAPVTESCQAAICQLEYSDANFPGRVGWKEVIVAPGAAIAIATSTVPLHDRSSQLSNYPADLIQSPPSEVAAKITYQVGVTAPMTTSAGAANDAPKNNSATAAHPGELKPNQQSTPRNSFTELMAAKQLSFAFVLLAALIAAGLGALHALEPGHGKTIVAAYLVGSKGTARHALLLGLIVTVSHTAGVYLLGGITLYAQKYILPDRIYPYLGVLSGILIAGMGCYLFLQRFLGAEFSHSHELPAAEGITQNRTPERRGSISNRQLLLLGMTGGIIPCPAALVVLLGAVALHRTAFGLFLIVTFSIGLAAVLIAMGMAAVFARRLMSRMPLQGPLVQRWLPMGSAAVITLLGVGLALRGLTAAGIVQFPLWS